MKNLYIKIRETEKKLFQSGIFVMKKDDTKKSQGSKVEDEKEEEREEMQEVFDTEFVKKELAKQKDKLPDDVYRKSKSILDMGTLTEKRLVKKLLNKEITPQRFRLLLQLLRSPEGADLEKSKLKRELAEQHITDQRITGEIFELALSAINRANPKTDTYEGDMELVKELVSASILGLDKVTTFRKKIKNKRDLKKVSVELQEKGASDRKDEVGPEEEVAKYSRQYRTTVDRAEQVMLLATPANVRETIEYRRLRDALAESRKGSIEDYNGLEDIFVLMAHGDRKSVPGIEDAVYGLFPEVVRENEKPVTKADLKTRLLELEKETGLDLQIGFYLDRLFDRLASFQKLRREVVEYETKISEIFRACEYRVAKRALEETAYENAGDWVGFSVKKGQKITYIKKTRNYETGEVKEEPAEGEIINVELSKPVILDESGEVTGERGTGTVLITVSGLGTLPEGEFRKLVDATDMCPVVGSVKELEEITGISETGISLQVGTELSYNEMVGRDGNGEVKTKERIVKIERIDNKGVELDREVTTLHKEEAPRLSVSGELDEDRKGKVLTLGQFAKWIRRRDAVPNPKTTAELQKMTDSIEEARNKKYETRNPNHFRAPQWTPRKTLFTDVPSGNVVPFRTHRAGIDEVREKDGGVEVVLDKRKISGAEALRTARKFELQDLDPDTEATRQTDFIDDEEVQKNEKRRVKKQIETDLLTQHKEEEEEEKEHANIPNIGRIIDWAEQQKVPGAVLSGKREIGQAKPPTYSYFKELWKQTNFLSLQDIWEFGKAAYEYHVRRWGRNVKNNYANVGRHFPYIGTEMERIKQQAETEEMNQFKEAMENWGIWQIEDTLYHSGTRDQAKACLIVLSSKGQMRWEDIRLWQALNKYVDRAHFIPIPVNGDFTAQDKYGKTGLDYIGPAIDFMWGEGTYSEWFNQNNNTFNQNKKSWHHKGDQLEGDPKNVGGVTAELGRLLQRHKMGHYVDPQEYEGLIDFCIHKGKSSAEAKIYYLVEGCAAKNSRGQSILPWDRIGNLDGEFLNRLPMLDYLTDKYTKKPFQESVRPWKRTDFEKLAEYWDGGQGRVPPSVAKDGTPPPKAIEFLWADVLRHPWVLARNNKGLRNADQIDHDDAHVIVPLASENLVQNICGSHVGTKKYFTEEAITNAFPGYNRYIRTLAEHRDIPKLLACIRSFVRFNSIVSNRYLKDKEDSYTRISKPNYYRRPVVDLMYTIDHKDQLEAMLKKVGAAYGWDISPMFQETHHVKTNKEQAEKQKRIEDFISNFGRDLEKRVMEDGGEKMRQAVLDSNLTGLYYDLPGGNAEVEQRKAKYDAEARVYGVFAGKM